MTKTDKRRIEQEAIKAAKEGLDAKTACPYPWHSEEALHWIAVWMLTRTPV